MLKIGTVYRTPSNQQKNVPQVDGIDNFYYITNTPGFGFASQSGIHHVRAVTTPSGERRVPLIIITSTPRKAGSKGTPWHDKCDPDNGYVKYYGDNKYYDTPQKPEDAPGNKVLLEMIKYNQCGDEADRIAHAVPIIIFEKCTLDGRAHGNSIFHGIGVIESAELVTQYDEKHRYFANYLFSFCILSLSDADESLDWDWIRDRCNSSLETKDTADHAPGSWKRWLKEGNESLHLLRRSISGMGLLKASDQKPSNMNTLKRIYENYGGKNRSNDKNKFEYLALEATMRALEESGTKCKPGWITKASGDGGVDFVLRADLGQGKLSSVKIVVLGQAKCTDPAKPVNGRDIARTVARLKRGWIGAFVTTSYFSESVQREVNEDDYPLLMINGAKIAEIVEREIFESKQTLEEYLDSLPTKYMQKNSKPEDILDY